MLTREQKQKQIEDLKGQLAPAQGVFVLDFTGLSVSAATELREKIRAAQGRYVVVKNTLARLALDGSDREPLKDLITGPTALASTEVDPVMLAKALADFAKTNDKLQFRGGFVEGQVLDAKQAQEIAALPSKQELVARLLYILQSPMRRLAVALAWPTRSLAVTVKQIADEKERQS